MSDIAATVGTYISVVEGKPATEDKAGYEALSWIEVGETGEFGEFGGVRQIIEWINTKDGVVQKRAGSINYGEQGFPLALDSTDAGQIALKDGLDGTNAGKIHSIKLFHPTYGDIYFQGIIAGFSFNPGGANSMFGGSANISVTNKPFVVARADAT